VPTATARVRSFICRANACVGVLAVAAGPGPAGASPGDGSHPFAVAHPIGSLSATGVSGLGEVTLALLFVLAVVFALAWAVRRMRTLGSHVGKAIDVLADVPLGQKERAVLLRVGQTHILVGVAPGRVNTLHVLPEPLDLATPSTTRADSHPPFRAALLRALGK
jgi:flagellar protein FliO/FliZ